MVVMPAGSFTMGSPQGEAGRFNDEGPQHWVTIAGPFAVSRLEITRGEFARFARATGYAAKGCHTWTGSEWKLDAAASWQTPGFAQTDDHPVVCVSFEDARAYAWWLGGKTGQPYRLPSEAEWEYAARAGTDTRRYWGDDSGDGEACRFANAADQTSKEKFGSGPVLSCRDGFVFTAPAGSYEPNAWKLRDMLGNVWEWVEDCWHDNYGGAPGDGSAWIEGECPRRVRRGGSWDYGPWSLRSAYRVGFGLENRNVNTGFRVARMFVP